jgi:hypothetical protein
MSRDKGLYGRALRLVEVLARRLRLGRISAATYAARKRRIGLAHYRVQHAAGATDYCKVL